MDYVGYQKCWREAYFLEEGYTGLENAGVFFFNICNLFGFLPLKPGLGGFVQLSHNGVSCHKAV